MLIAKRIQVLLFISVSACASVPRQPAVAISACAGSWSPPFRIQRADGRPVYVEPGLIATQGDRTLLLGTPTFFWLGKDDLVPSALATDTVQQRWAFTRAGALVDSAGTATGVPMIDPAVFRREPQLLGTRGKRLSVAWATSDPPYGSVKDGPYPLATHLDVATFDGQRWSAPEAIMRARRIHLDGAPASDGSTAVVMMVTMKDGGTNLYSVRADWSHDSVTWTQPVLIDSIRGSFTHFVSARLGGDSLVVVRSRSLQEGDRGGTIMTALSVDGGRSWKQTEPLAIGSDMHPRLVVDGSGRLHVVYRGSRQPGLFNAPGAVMHPAWVRGEWTKPGAVSTDESITDPAVGTALGERLMITWTEARMEPTGITPKTVARFWSPGCGL